uniref:Uncharacterized protein n=1 Tax=Panagrolaimus sp. JU765 TaxID=591449 RepID=A0AC34QR25_9BILA
MLYWELRRQFRQKWRHLRPIPKGVTYAQYSRRRVIVTFVLFFIGWKVLGVTLSERLLYRPDEKTGEWRYHQPWEMKSIIHSKRVALEEENYPRLPKLTVTDVTQFPLDD